jgi:protoheme IX farnesyltransferase
MSRASSYFELTKPRLTALVILTTWLGFALAKPGVHNWLLLNTLLGSWLVASGAAALNQYIERELDARMHRTKKRPLPSQRVTSRGALLFGIALSVVGTLELAWGVNLLTAGLALLTLSTYLWAYTPMKTRTSLSTLVGAIPGAIPPMMGWTAATGRVTPEAWVLFAILFLWQLPHFLAIAWMYREDYARGGFPLLPVIDPDGGSTARMILLYTAVLIPVTLLPTSMGLAGMSYGIAALLLGAGFFACGAFVAWKRTTFSARRLMFASILYLPLLLGCLAWAHRY